MTQYVINIGSLPNDGTGDPLRTAFNETNLNFNQVFAAGPVLSNIRIANNTILTTNTNGNLVLAPNGIGRIQANATVVPSVANVRDLGSLTQRWNTVYTQNLNASGFITGQFGNITVAVGNLHISGGSNGYVLQTDGNGNLTWTAQTGGSGNAVPAGANTQVQFNNAGSFGGDPDFYFNNTTNTLVVNGNLNEHSVELGSQGFTNLSANVIAQITGNANSYTQVNFQNISSGNRATTDYIATSAFGTDSTYFVNMGIAGGNYDSSNPDNSLGTSLFPQDSYLYAQGGNSVGGTGGNLVVGSNEPGGVVRVIADGSFTANVVATFSNTGIDVKGNINPVANNTQSLGNATNRWANLWLSGNTIQLGDLSLSASANGLTSTSGFDLENSTAANIEATGNITANYFFGDGSQLTGISITSNALVNGDNAFVLNSDGNVVFEGETPGDGVNRGLVWDYGAVANGVNSTVRQDNAGLTVRAWTEMGGGGNGYSAPVRVVTNQDAAEKEWIFNGDGDLILPGNMILAEGNIRSNAINPAFNSAITGINSGNATVIITIASELFEGPFSGPVTISGVNPPVQANGDWWYQAVEIDQFQLFNDQALTDPVDGTDWPGYVDGGTAVSAGDYENLTIQGGNVSISSNSNSWTFDTTGNLSIPGAIISASTILIDNRASGNTADIQLFAADDITIQARDRTLGSGSEGGDINIYAGDSAEDGDSSGGDIQIFAGDGGAGNVDFGGSGGFITIRSGQGGSAIGNTGATARSGGALTLQAGSAGGNNGNADLGNAGGDVFITAGATTGNNSPGGDIVLTTGTGGSNGTAGNVRITIPSSDQGAGGTWTFDGTGNLIVPSNGNINASDGSTARFQSLDEGIVRSSVTLAPADGLTRLESFDNQDSNGYTTSDWATGEYVNNGGFGEITFTDAPSIISFFSTIDTSRVFYQVNGGNLLPSSGYGSGGNNITFYTDIPPVASPTTVTTFTIYYSNRSVIEMDYDEGEMNLNARNLDINITSDQSIDLSTRDIIRLQNTGNSSGVAIITDAGNAFHTWNFQANGNLALPAGGSISEGPSPSYLGNAVTITPANGGDPNQQLKIYPTAAEGNHLHLTSGNLQVTDVFLGDDSQYIRTTTTGGMIVGTGGGEIFGGYAWSFEENGNLIFPDGSSIGGGAFNGTASSTVSLNAFSPDGNTVSIQAQGNTSSAVISIFANSGPVTNNWIFTQAALDPTEALLYVPPGASISTPDATGGEGGKNIFIVAGASDPETWNSNPGGELFIQGGYGSFGDGGGGPGGNVNIQGGFSSDSHTGNVNITCGSNGWVFDYSGNVTIPGNINAVVSSPAPSINGFNSVNSVNVNASGNVSATGNVSGDVGFFNDVIVNNAGTNSLLYTNSNREIYDTAFAYDAGNDVISGTGAITTTGNITGGNLTVGSGTITGGNVNGATFNGNVAFGTGTVGGSGNITGGNISAIGNITGNTAGFAIGYRDIPQVSFTGNATIATTDAGKHFYSTQSSNFTLTIANNASQGFQVGAAITVVNQGTGTISIAQGSGVTLYLAGNATSGNRSVSTFGMATIMKVATDTWFINGTGVS